MESFQSLRILNTNINFIGVQRHILGDIRLDQKNRIVFYLENDIFFCTLQNTRNFGKAWVDISSKDWQIQNNKLDFKIGLVEPSAMGILDRYHLYIKDTNIMLDEINSVGYITSDIICNLFEFNLLQANIRKYLKNKG